jgi:hypothetical protein
MTNTVLLGRFNPLIFSPDWLVRHNIIGPAEGAEAQDHGIEVMAPNISSINLGSMKLIVEETRFMLSVAEEPLVRSKDFAASCFRLLSHTPVFAIGLNFSGTLYETDPEKWHRFGDTLAPKGVWGEFLTGLDGKRLGGLRALVMDRASVLGGRDGYNRCTIQVAERGLEALVQINMHFNIGTPDRPSDGATAYKLIEELWDDGLKEATATIQLVRTIADAA